MVEIRCEVLEAKKPEFPVRDLLKISGDRDLIVSLLVFGPNIYSDNLGEMQKTYSHPITGERITFREPATSESISAAVYYVADTKQKILNPALMLQLGRVVRTSEGVYTNPPKDKQGNPITDEKTLKSLLDKAKNGIYLCENYFGFAPNETFEQGVQDCDTFVEGGLARLFEHTEEKTAKNLRTIASRFYKGRVNVWGFDKVNEPVLRVVSLVYYRDLVSNGLGVIGDWNDYDDGYAFGVLNETGEACPKNL